VTIFPGTPVLALVPGHAPGTGANTGSSGLISSVLERAALGHDEWLGHVWNAAACSHPIRLHGTLTRADRETGEVRSVTSTDEFPDAVIYKPCGNRRTAACPGCAETYRRDAYQLIRAGLAGGKGIPDTVAGHPAVFATFTAPSFGPVHARPVRRHTCRDRSACRCTPEPCHARHDAPACPHGVTLACYRRHGRNDPAIGTPLCPDCYDYDAAAVWNNASGELWRRTKQDIERHLNALARSRGLPKIRLSHGKVAEYQARGAVHFHVLIRLDGIHPDDTQAIIPPPAGITALDLDQAIRQTAASIAWTTGPHPAKPGGWRIAWGAQTDVRHITARGTATITDLAVAAYLAKYSTKGTEASGHASARLTPDTIDLYASATGTHAERLIAACWQLGTAPGLMYGSGAKAHGWDSLRRWAHMLGFGGHFLTKARRYSVTFGALRHARITYRRTQDPGPEHGPIHDQDPVDDETTIVLTSLTYAGIGWHTTGDALLANTAADQARKRRETGREELAAEQSEFSSLRAVA
jgi:hypothetical protein